MKTIIHSTLLAIVYTAFAIFSVELTRTGSSVALIWLPNAVLLALLVGRDGGTSRWMTGVVIPGGVIANMMYGDGFSTALGLAFANWVEIITALSLYNWLLADRFALARVRDYLALILGPSVVAPLLGGGIGAGVVAFAYGAPWLDVFATWYISDVIGYCLILPLGIVGIRYWNNTLKLVSGSRLSPPIAALVGGGLAAGYLAVTFSSGSHEFLIFLSPLMIAISLMLGVIGVVGASCAILASVVAESLHGHEVANTLTNFGDPILDFQVFLLVNALPAFVIAVMMEERETATRAAEKAGIAKSEFLANMSHEIKTPLNAILGSMQLLELGDTSDTQDRQIKMAKEASERLFRQLNDVLELSRLGAEAIEILPEDCSVTYEVAAWQDFAQAAVAREETPINVEIDISGAIQDQFFTDQGRLMQIMTNLISNAVKFTKAGRIVIGAHFNPDVKIDTMALMFFVKDTGCGIAEDDLDRIFNRFEQSDNSQTRVYGGTGLGLAISSELARLMGGKLSVKSIVGEGATFTLCLPIHYKA